MKNKIIIGLGNEGEEFLNTRHNLGHFAVELIAKNSDEIFIQTPGCINNCGNFIKDLIKSYDLVPDQILFIHDNLNMQLGETKYSYSKNTFGHNGLKSVKEAVNGEAFHKLSIGIGRPDETTSILQYVLGQMSMQENDVFFSSLPQIQTLINVWLKLPYKVTTSTIC